MTLSKETPEKLGAYTALALDSKPEVWLIYTTGACTHKLTHTETGAHIQTHSDIQRLIFLKMRKHFSDSLWFQHRFTKKTVGRLLLNTRKFWRKWWAPQTRHCWVTEHRFRVSLSLPGARRKMICRKWMYASYSQMPCSTYEGRGGPGGMCFASYSFNPFLFNNLLLQKWRGVCKCRK